jgi:replicative DNA helicase
MADKERPISEGEALDSFLARLQSVHEVKEIAGWETGFPKLSAALNGISPGLCLLIGPPGCGKTAFAGQLLDQVTQLTSVSGLCFTFSESKDDLRIRTLARLSGVETREIRRGPAYLLHWYGVPKRRTTDPEVMPPSWDRLKRAAEEAKGWLDLLYLFECDHRTTLRDIEKRTRAVVKIKGSARACVVIDDAQRLGERGFSVEARLPLVAERLEELAMKLDIPLLATWPALTASASTNIAPEEWAERVAGANAIIVMEEDAERTKQFTEPKRAITLHIVKNRGGEKTTINFDFSPGLSTFAEAAD